MTSPTPDRLEGRDLVLGYDGRTIIEGLTVAVPPGQITSVVGANACGKSTLLRGLARLLNPAAGQVLLSGVDLHTMSSREVATRLGILPQTPTAPDGITVADLVARGRYPHQRWYRQWSETDEAAVVEALVATGTHDLADRGLDELSGGQRQRVWIAMALAQGTGIVLLDEPTTYLDMAHQVEVLELLVDLNEQEGRTVVMVLHDLNQACRYSHHLIAMRDGAIITEGNPVEVVDEELVRTVFGLETQVIPDPVTGTPMVVPVGRARALAR